jgi:hypothetical protein
MINIEEMTIGQLREITALLGNKPATEMRKDLGFQIVVCDRGFVYSGQTVIAGEYAVITGGKNIRKWGTTKGLGQLAESGPTGDTVLDPVGEITVPMKAVIHFIKCKSSW